MMSTRPHWMSSISADFFTYLFHENLAEHCRHVVVRIANPPEEEGKGQGRRRQRHSQGKLVPDVIMRGYGFEKEKITKAKLCKLQMNMSRVLLLYHAGLNSSFCNTEILRHLSMNVHVVFMA